MTSDALESDNYCSSVATANCDIVAASFDAETPAGNAARVAVEQVGQESVRSVLEERQLRGFGHVYRMERERKPK
jgi:hypothetical protein